MFDDSLIIQALKELRNLFPRWNCEISEAYYLGEKTGRLYKRVDIHCTDFTDNDWIEYGPTLDAAMIRVRQRRESKG